MDKFSISLWLRVLRAIALVAYVGITQRVIMSFDTQAIYSASVLGVLCLMPAIILILLGMFADIGNFQVALINVVIEGFMFAFNLSATILNCLRIRKSHLLAQSGAIPVIMYYLVEGAAASSMLTFAVTCVLLVFSLHNVGTYTPKNAESKCHDIERDPKDVVNDETNIIGTSSSSSSSSQTVRKVKSMQTSSPSPEELTKLQFPRCLSDPSKVVPVN